MTKVGAGDISPVLVYIYIFLIRYEECLVAFDPKEILKDYKSWGGGY